MEPVVPPLLQYSNVGNPYPSMANPNATSPAPQLTIPDAPKNCWVFSGDAGILTVNWVMPMNAFVFAVWRGTASGMETLLTNVYNNDFYIDKAVSIGTTYYYYVTGANSKGVSAPSNEASATVLAANTP
jgi:cellulose 1,4-beta-cellobiosidase